jgi:ATP-dependent DNA ligase
VLYVDHTKGACQRLYELACPLDLEGIVAKRAAGQNANGEDWIKIKNPNYSQKEGRGDLFRRAG